MLVPMTKVRLLGARRDVERVVDELHQLGLVEIADARASLAVEELGGDEDRSKRREELRRLAAQTDGLLTLIAGADTDDAAHEHPVGRRWTSRRSRAELEPMATEAEDLAAGWRRSATSDWACPATSSRSAGCCRSCPSSPTSTTSELRRSGSTRSRSCSTPTTSSSSRRSRGAGRGARRPLRAGVDARRSAAASAAWSCSRRRHRRAVHALLGHAQVRQAELPEAFKRLSLRAAVEAMQRRLAALPDADRRHEREREALLRPHAARLGVLRAAIADELERLDALDRFASTQRAFVAECWVPRRDARAPAARGRSAARRRGARRGPRDLSRATRRHRC